MYFLADREGRVVEENSLQDRFLEWMYGHAAGRVLLRPLVSPAFSKAGGRFLDSRFSKLLIPVFIRNHSIDMKEFEQKEYSSYNEFFKRRMLPGAREIENASQVFVSPCDSRLSVYKISGEQEFSIKNTKYTAAQLLRSRKLAGKYSGGYAWVFRLCVEDYHRYVYVDGGRVSPGVRIPGIFHTVNPAANDRYPIYVENTREYSLLQSDNFGTILQMEVGALLVGKIENRTARGNVQRGQEKGNFAFGGSTVILLTQAGKVQPDQDILDNSRKGIETKVKLGERVGCAYGEIC